MTASQLDLVFVSSQKYEKQSRSGDYFDCVSSEKYKTRNRSRSRVGVRPLDRPV